MNNTQSRKWLLVINNPQEAGLTHERISEILTLFSPDYYCMADERATTGTLHTHIFIYSHSPIRSNTIKNRFPIAHIEKSYGSTMDNRNYILKTCKWENSDKSETSIEGSFYEFGEIPTEQQEKSPKMSRLIADVRSGMKTTEIIDTSPEFVFKIRDIDLLRQTLLYEKYKSQKRNITVTYLFGATGTGKTRSIFDKHDADDICRITNYSSKKGISFDGYSGQRVLVFEEFNSQIPIEEMLNYLDIYPLYLPARYNDKIACYEIVYITSNLPLSEQYREVQKNRPETWKAFLRRIHKVVEYCPGGTKKERNKDYGK